MGKIVVIVLGLGLVAKLGMEKLEMPSPVSTPPAKIRIGQILLAPRSSPSESPKVEPSVEKKEKKPDGWNLAAHGLDPNEVLPLFGDEEPMEIHYWKDGELVRLKGNSAWGVGRGVGKYLTLSDEASIKKVQEDRRQTPDHNLLSDFFSTASSDKPNTRGPDKPKKKVNAHYRVISFKPGFLDGHKKRISKPRNMAASIAGPDHKFDPIDPSDPEALARLREKTVSFGHGGEMVIEIIGGVIANESGEDFVIFENPFPDSEYIYPEYARVAVAEVQGEYRWFECDPARGKITWCAGQVPTDYDSDTPDNGGDKFDLSVVGLSKAKYIKIVDTNLNFDNMGFGTEGFDLDALKLVNVAKE